MEDVVRSRGAGNWRLNLAEPQTTLLGGGPHAMDSLRWLMGVRFTSAQALHAEQKSEWQTLHTTVAIFKAENGAVAKVTTSYGMERPYCLYYSVYGSEGSFERSRDQADPGGTTQNYFAHNRMSGTRHMIPVTLPAFSSPDWARQAAESGVRGAGHGTMELQQAADFLGAIVNDREPGIGPREAADSIVPLICALESAKQGGGLVAIPSY